MRAALLRSIEITPNVLQITIDKQRVQLRDQMKIADTARAQIGEEAGPDDFELWAIAARNATDVAKALKENLEMQTKSRATVQEADTLSLIAELKKRATGKEKDADAIAALAKPAKGAARGRV